MKLTTFGMIVIPLLVATLFNQRRLEADETAFDNERKVFWAQINASTAAHRQAMAEIDRQLAAQRGKIASAQATD